MENKMPTIREIAKKLQISPSTVSRALHNHHSIGLGTKMRVQELAKKLQYEPNQNAIFFKQRRTFSVGVILPNLSESFFSSAISGIEDFAIAHHYKVLFGQSHDDAIREGQILETMKNFRVDGILVSISKSTTNYDHFKNLKKYNIPIVFFDRIPAMSNINYIACDLEAGIQEAVDFLVSKGHQCIGLINGPNSMLACKEGLRGFKNVLKKHNLKQNPSLIVSTDLSQESTYQAMQKLLSLKNRPSAVISFNDYVALDAIQYAKKMKVKINKDISFVSFANLPLSSYIENTPLASIEQFPYEQGKMAMEILLKLVDEGHEKRASKLNYNISLSPKLEIRIQ
jgi:LacI family transcriptional regulator, repressor for deo operon, udp, cdd, tsx, nupC, and nupG